MSWQADTAPMVEWMEYITLHYTTLHYTAPRIRRRIRTWRSRGQSVAAAAARGHRHVLVPALFPRRRCWQDTATASAKLLGPSLDTNAASAQCSAWQHSAIPGVDARQARTNGQKSTDWHATPSASSMDALVPACSPWASFSGAKDPAHMRARVHVTWCLSGRRRHWGRSVRRSVGRRRGASVRQCHWCLPLPGTLSFLVSSALNAWWPLRVWKRGGAARRGRRVDERVCLVPEKATIRRSPELRRNQQTSKWNRPELPSERERGEGSGAQLGSHRHRVTPSTVLQCNLSCRGREAVAHWTRASDAHPALLRRCRRHDLPLQPPRDLPTHSLTHHPPTNKAALIAGRCRGSCCCCCLHLIIHQCQDRIELTTHAPHPPADPDRWVDEGPPLTFRG